MGGLVGSVVLESEAERKPSLLDLGVGVGSDAEILVNQGQDGQSNVVVVLQQGRVEDRLQV